MASIKNNNKSKQLPSSSIAPEFKTTKNKLREITYYKNRIESISHQLKTTTDSRLIKALNRNKTRFTKKLHSLNLIPQFIYIPQSIVEAPDCRPIGHCIGKDALLSAGAALALKTKYPTIVPSTNNTVVGRCCITTCGTHKFINIVTKPLSKRKPNFQDFTIAINDLKQTCIKNNWRSLSITKLGSGLDNFDWNKEVQPLIKQIFKDFAIDLYVHTLK